MSKIKEYDTTKIIIDLMQQHRHFIKLLSIQYPNLLWHELTEAEKDMSLWLDSFIDNLEQGNYLKAVDNERDLGQN